MENHCIIIAVILLMTAGESSADCFDDILPKNTDEIKKNCPLVHEQMMICIPEILFCLTSLQNSRKCHLNYHNCIEKISSELESCERYKSEVTDHVKVCTDRTFEKLKKETLEKALKTLEVVMRDVLGANYTSIVPKRPDSLTSFLRLLKPFTNSSDVNSDDKLREKIVEVDRKLLSEFKTSLKFWHGGFGNNVVSRLIDRTLVKVSWDSVNMKYGNHGWAEFADCLENANETVCMGKLGTSLKKLCLKNSDQLQCGVYMKLVEEELKETFSSTQRLSNERIYKVISKFKLNDFWMTEYVIRENKLPLFHLEYKYLFESCYSVKRTVSSCLLISHYCEEEAMIDCMEELQFCFSNITTAKPKCLDRLFVINERTKAVSNFVDWGKERMWWIGWSLFLLFVNIICTWAIRKGADSLWSKLKKRLVVIIPCCSGKKKETNEAPDKNIEMLESGTRVEEAENETKQPTTKDEGKVVGARVEAVEQLGNNSNDLQVPEIKTDEQSSSTDNGDTSAPTDALLKQSQNK